MADKDKEGQGKGPKQNWKVALTSHSMMGHINPYVIVEGGGPSEPLHSSSIVENDGERLIFHRPVAGSEPVQWIGSNRPAYAHATLEKGPGGDLAPDDIADLLEPYKAMLAFNTKWGEGEVDLAMDGWCFSTNAESAQVDGYIREREASGIETHVDDVAYYGDAWSGVISGNKAIYERGKPRVPEEVIRLAMLFRAHGSEEHQRKFLTGVLEQIRSESGEYYERLKDRKGQIAPVLNYFADKFRRLDMESEAKELEAAVEKYFPQKQQIYIPLESKRPAEPGIR